MIPLTVDVPMKRLPWANWGLILATVAVSLAVPHASSEAQHDPSAPWNGPKTGDKLFDEAMERIRKRKSTPRFSRLVLQRDRFEAHQLVMALFQHAGLLHLFGNMLFLFVFGNAINAKLGHAGFLASYLGIGVLAHLVFLAFSAVQACLGASGAIMGMCGMFLVLYPRNGVTLMWNEDALALFSRSWSGELPGWAVVLLYLAFDIWGAVFDRDSNIGYVSHIVGGLMGIALAVIALKAGWLAPDRGEQTLLQWLAGEGPTEEAPRRPRKKKVRLSSSGNELNQ